MLLLITTGVKGSESEKRKENSVAEIMKIIFPESFFEGGKLGLYLKCYQNKLNERKSNRNKTKPNK